MLVIVCLITALAVVLVIIAIMPLSFCVQYIREGKNDYLDLKLLLHSIKIYKHRIYMVDLKLNHNEAAIHFKAAPHKKHSDRHMLKKIKIPELKEVIRQVSFWHDIYKDIKPVLKKFRKTLTVKRLLWKTRIGFEDPFLTGMIIGLVWSIKGALLSIVSQRLKFSHPPILKVVPDFNVSCLLFRFETVLATKPIFVFSALIKILVILIAGGRLKKVITMINKLPRKKTLPKHSFK